MSWAVIGGSGALGLFDSFAVPALPPGRFGPPSAPPRRGVIGSHQVWFLARHGEPHRIAPHLIDYRANLLTLHEQGVERIVALNTVGGISAAATAGALFVPDQLIDYTWGRAHTFADRSELIHADFAEPLDGGVRHALLAAGKGLGLEIHDGGVYGCTQGPRFETAAEIERMARDGCDLVGMTGMPEAGLARELGLAYAMLSLVVNPAAGRAADPFDLEAIRRVSAAGMARVQRLLVTLFESLE